MFSKLFGKSDAGAASHDIGHDDLLQAVHDKACVVVDVREPHEFAGGRIPGALNLPLSRFDARQLPSDRPVVLICQAGGRSATALRQTHGAGRGDARHYPGGMGGWRRRGGPVET